MRTLRGMEFFAIMLVMVSLLFGACSSRATSEETRNGDISESNSVFSTIINIDLELEESFCFETFQKEIEQFALKSNAEGFLNSVLFFELLANKYGEENLMHFESVELFEAELAKASIRAVSSSTSSVGCCSRCRGDRLCSGCPGGYGYCFRYNYGTIVKQD